MFDLEQELKNLPEDPGVYIMHDKVKIEFEEGSEYK